MRSILAWATLVAVSLTAMGCSKMSAKEFCEMRAACEGLSEEGRQQCLDDEQDYIDDAFDWDCGKEVEVAFDCAAKESKCDNGMLDTTPCFEEFQEVRDCMAEAG